MKSSKPQAEANSQFPPRRLAILAIAVATIAIASCASIFQGTTEEISVNSEPQGATVTLGSGENYTTPFTITVPRNQDVQLHFSKPGYQSRDLTDNSKIEGGYMAADFLTLFGPPIDAATGAAFEHEQSTVTVRLEPVPDTSVNPTKSDPTKSPVANGPQ